MRIAVCISGQPRTWRTAKDNILNYFDLHSVPYKTEIVKVDYFIHTWNTNSYRDKTQPRWENEDYLVQENEESDIRSAFNPIYMEFEHFNFDDHLPAWSGLFYSFMKSVMLKRKYELDNDFVYDIVIKTRFDINFPQEGFNKFRFPMNKFFIHNVSPLIGYASGEGVTKFPFEFNYNCFDDVYFYSDSPTMDIISNVYRWYREVQRIGMETVTNREFIQDTSFYYGPGTLLYKHLVNWGIHPHGELACCYYVVRKEAEYKGLNGVKDWQEIYKISKEWYEAVIKI